MSDNKVTLIDRVDSKKKRRYTSQHKPARIKLRAHKQFELVLENDNGNLIPFQKVRVIFDDGSREIVRVDENGYYKFVDIPEGPVTIEMLDLDDLYAASHAANIKKAFQGGQGEKNIVFESLKLPPLSVQRLVEIYNEESSQSNKPEFASDLENYLKLNFSREEKLACYALLARVGIKTFEKNAEYFIHGQKSINYGIRSEPNLKAIIPGTKVRYYAGPKFASIMDENSGYTYQWFCFNDPSSVKNDGAEPVFIGPSTYVWEVGDDEQWKFIGNHTLCCRIQFMSSTGDHDAPIYVELQQGIKTEEAILAEALENYNDLPDPDNALLALSKYIDLLKQAEKTPGSEPLDPNFMMYLESQRDKMIEQFSLAAGKRKYPVKAVHIDYETSEITKLRTFISFVDKDIIWDDWILVDWTNVMDRRLTGVYEGEGRYPTLAIEDIIDDWDSDNRYPRGKIKIIVPENTPGEGYQREFETDGSSFWDSASNLLSYVALGGAIIAGVVTLIAPVPGSRVLSCGIWTSIGASTASATINIGQRHAEGFGDFKEDAIDSLTIVGNLLSAGWMTGAKVAGLKQFAGSKLGKGFIVGQFATDGVQGILVAEDFIKEYEAIMKIKDPHERTAKLIELTRSTLVAGTLTYISLRGTAKDMSLGRDFNKLKSTANEFDLSKTPKVEGNTNDKTLKVIVQDQAIVKENAGNYRSRLKLDSGGPGGNSPVSSSPKEAGMPYEHFRIFQDTAIEEQMYILVRNSNPASTKYIKLGYPAKPMSVKAKTNKLKHGGTTDGISTIKQTNGILDTDELNSVLADPNNYIVIRDNSGNYVAKNSEDEIIILNRAKNKNFTAEELGWVIDGKTQLPFVSDYDLQAVFFMEDTKYISKKGTVIENLKPSQAALWDVSEGKKDITNPWINNIRGKLNKKLSKIVHIETANKIPQERVLHGADEGFAPIGDDITVFRPDGGTELLKTKDDVQKWYDKIGRKPRYPN